MSRKAGARWRAFTEAVEAMQPGDTVAWDVPCLEYANEIAGRIAKRGSWLWASRASTKMDRSQSGRIHMARFT